MDMDKDKAFKELVLAEYRKTVQNVLDRKECGVVHNERPEHAAIILEEMAKRAKTSFYAFTRSLSSDVWNDAVITAVAEASKRGVDVRLLVTDCLNPSESRIPEVLQPRIWSVPSNEETKRIHYAEMDSRAVRIENDVEQRKAFFSANAPDAATLIHKLIAQLSGAGKPCFQA